MSINNILYAIICVSVWGTTWLAIKFQLGVLDPLWSVAIRFLLASGILFLICYFKKISWRMTDHRLAFLLGAGLFGFNYWCTYLSESYVSSALTAVMFSTMVFLNLINAAAFLKDKISFYALLGAGLGIFGVALIYWPEFILAAKSANAFWGASIALIGAYLASLGNIVAKKMSQKKIHVFQMNAWGMLYGAGIMMFLAIVMHRPIVVTWQISYWISLLYLVVFGSVIAFSAYLSLSNQIGPGKAGYVTLFVPVIAMGMSWIFEGYQIGILVMAGVMFLIAGNYLALLKK